MELFCLRCLWAVVGEGGHLHDDFVRGTRIDSAVLMEVHCALLLSGCAVYPNGEVQQQSLIIELEVPGYAI